MEIAILTFSPSGSTTKVGNKLSHQLRAKGHKVKTFDITGDKAYFHSKDRLKVLEKKLIPHDVLVVGGPVYACHMQYQILDIIKSLPAPGNGWGDKAIPFVTYGGVTSGSALKETSVLLKKSKRSILAAMKIDSQHSVSKHFEKPLNEGLPGKEAELQIGHLTDMIDDLGKENKKNKELNLKELDYHPLSIRLKNMLFFDEKKIHKVLSPKVYNGFEVDEKKCTSCGACAEKCSVQRISMVNNNPVPDKEKDPCLFCLECYGACNSGAIKMTPEKVKGELEGAKKGKGFFFSGEFPRDQVFK